MKIHCTKSGLQLTVSYFPGTTHATHPVFGLEQHKLLSYAGKWSAGELTTQDSYLLFLALLDSTSLLHWRCPATQNDAAVATNMEALFKCVGHINLIHHPSFVLPNFVISPETASLDNVHYWIEAWNSSYQDFMNGYRTASEYEKLKRREYALERMIKSTQLRNNAKYATALAVWAALAGSFPEFTMIHPLTSQPVTCSDYWQDIIKHCVKESRIHLYPDKDIDELILHCEENIPHGSIHAHALMDLLRTGRKYHDTFLKLPDFDFDAYKAGLSSSDNEVENANKAALIETAPTEAPQRQHYSSELEYVRAKMKYKMRLKYITQPQS